MEKHSVSRLSYLFAHLHLLSSYSFSSTLLSSNLSLLSASALLCFSSVHIVGSLTSKLPSNICSYMFYIFLYSCSIYVFKYFKIFHYISIFLGEKNHMPTLHFTLLSGGFRFVMTGHPQSSILDGRCILCTRPGKREPKKYGKSPCLTGNVWKCHYFYDHVTNSYFDISTIQLSSSIGGYPHDYGNPMKMVVPELFTSPSMLSVQ